MGVCVSRRNGPHSIALVIRLYLEHTCNPILLILNFTPPCGHCIEGASGNTMKGPAATPMKGPMVTPCGCPSGCPADSALGSKLRHSLLWSWVALL